MLEIKNVTKIYKTKGGVETKALDNVSISFGETGLIFLLGKSGSGKSTLLNVSGGLDEPTSGEVVVKGKSSKDFSASDFDSYRNTFVGFIFQEYNVLDEFNVEDNIALALELQGKPKDKEKIQQLLRDVELEDFAKRKPNTLSGGQKQRIAIARALVKDPQIIMADEPTGALDSATGKQVLDTLKKLSQSRLVIVVSHDREFAETYGDRIVELKDGKIISDISKAADTPERFEATCEAKLNIKRYDKDESNFIRSRLPMAKAIKIGASGLKLKPFRLIMTILLSVIAFIMFGLFSTLMVYDGDKVARSSYMNSNYNFIKLDKRYELVRINSKGERSNVSSNAGFTQEEVQQFADKYGKSTYAYFMDDVMNNLRIENVKMSKTQSNYYLAELCKFAYIAEDNPLRNTIVVGEYPQKPDEICISSYTAETLLLPNCELYSVEFGDDGDITYGSKVSVTSQNDLIGKYIVTFSGRSAFKITGVFDSGEISENYDSLKTEDKQELFWNYQKYLRDGMFLLGFVSKDYCTKEYAQKLCSINNTDYSSIRDYFDSCLNFISYMREEDSRDNDVHEKVKAYEGEAADGLKSIFLGGDKKSTLSDNEIIMPVSEMAHIMQNDIIAYYKELVKNGEFADEFNIPELLKESDIVYDESDTNKEHGYYYIVDKEHKYYNYNEYKQEYELFYEINVNSFAERKYSEVFLTEVQKYEKGTYSKEIIDDNGESVKENVQATNEERLAALDYITNISNRLQPKRFYLIIDHKGKIDCTLVGFHEVDIYHNGDSADGMLLPQSFIDNYLELSPAERYTYETNYVPEVGAIYSGLCVAYDRSARVTDELFGLLGSENKNANDVYYVLDDMLADSIDLANYYANTFSIVFLWVGVAFAVFSALLLFNFISVSISNKRKEIGILRAVGARGTDVFKIFFAESGIITGICTVLAIIGTIAACALINGLLKTQIGFEVTLFVFGIASVAMMVAIALLVAFIGTFLPVYLAARKKPVDSIRAL